MADYPTKEGYHIVEEYVVPEDTIKFLADNFKKKFDNKIVLGTSSDEVLEILPAFLMIWSPSVLGHDKDGLIVEWDYGYVIFTLSYAPTSFDSRYCVQQIQVKDEI